MNFPLQLRFKKLALAPQLSVTDADGTLRFYVKQKLFKLKEAVTVFGDREQREPLFQIRADRIMDFRARYEVTDRSGTPVGAVRREGARSIWRARYEVLRGDTQVMRIQEEQPWVKVLDSILGGIPVVEFFTGYFLNPAYSVSRPDGTRVLRLVKEPALTEGKFRIEKHAEMDPREQELGVLSLLMMTLLEKERG